MSPEQHEANNSLADDIQDAVHGDLKAAFRKMGERCNQTSKETEKLPKPSEKSQTRG